MDHQAHMSWSQSSAMVALFTGMAIFFCIGDLIPVTGLWWRIMLRAMFGAMFAKMLETRLLRRQHGMHGMAKTS